MPYTNLRPIQVLNAPSISVFCSVGVVFFLEQAELPRGYPFGAVAPNEAGPTRARVLHRSWLVKNPHNVLQKLTIGGTTSRMIVRQVGSGHMCSYH